MTDSDPTQIEGFRPGSAGEHELQRQFGDWKRAAAFYDKQMLDRLNDVMVEFIARQEMAFVATSDGHGECDATFRAGAPGFIRVIDAKTVMYPEYRGNGVMASLGNISENPHIGILFVDFQATIGLHVNGKARIVPNEAVEAFAPMLSRMAGVEQLHDESTDKKTTPERWVMVDVEEAYIHCSKHIPMLQKLDKDVAWGTDDAVRKGGDYFKAKNEPRPWSVKENEAAAAAAAAAEAEPVVETEPVAEVAPEPVVEAAPEPAAEIAPEPVADMAEEIAHVAAAAAEVAEAAAEVADAAAVEAETQAEVDEVVGASPVEIGEAEFFAVQPVVGCEGRRLSTQTHPSVSYHRS